MDLIAILNLGASSLAAHRAVTATAGHNMANVNTPGYARQRAELVTRGAQFWAPSSYLGRGVVLERVTQARDRFIERQLPAVLGNAARSSAEAHALRSVNALDPDGPGGLAAAIGDFYSSARALSQNAGDMSLRRAFVGTSQRLALAFNRTAQGLEFARDGLDAELENMVAEVNISASELAELNAAIKSARSSGAEPNDLLDRRQMLVDRLAELTGATPINDGEGYVNIALPGGLALVSGVRAGSLSTVADPGLGGHLALQLTRADGTGPQALTAAQFGGRAAGLLEARDAVIGQALDRLDSLAFDLATGINLLHSAGLDLSGNSGNNLFTVPVTPGGAASTIAVNAAIVADPRLIAAGRNPGGGAGDAWNLFRIINTETANLATSGVPAAATLSRITADFGAATRRAEAVTVQDQTMADHLHAMREATAGVSIDEEMVTLTQAQRAYEATMKVISTADQMLETLMQLR